MPGRVLRLAIAALLVTATSGATDWYVDPAVGVDAPGGGTSSAPWKTLTYAESRGLPELDRILLAPGTYDESSGEVFPIPVISRASIVGAGGAASTLRTTAGAPKLLQLSYRQQGAMTIEGLVLESPAMCIAIDQGIRPIDSSGPLIRRNVFRCGTTGIAARGDYEGRLDLTIESNRFEGGSTGVYASANAQDGSMATSVVLQNNVFLGNGRGLAVDAWTSINGWGDMHRFVVNNTFVDVGIGISTNSGDHWPVVVGNIFHGCNVGVSDLGSVVTSTNRLDANVFFANGTDYWDIVLGPLNGAAALATQRDAHPAFPNLDGDPAMRSPGTGDVRLTARSVCLDRGDDAIAPADDFEGQPRPQDGDGDQVARSDIGADEWDGTVPTQDLVRAVLQSAAPRLPDLATLYPLDPGRPGVEVLWTGFSGSALDPETGVLSRADRPLVLYSVSGNPSNGLRAAKDVAGDTVRLSLR